MRGGYMKIGVFSILFNDLPLEDVLSYLSRQQIHTIELGTGGYSRSNHVDVPALLHSETERLRFSELLKRYGFSISGLGTQGNPVHPDPEQAKRYHHDFVQTVLLAEKLKVDTVLVLSGCPGGCKEDRTPNWITCPWPEDYSKALEYQWEEVLIPYWHQAAAFAEEHGVTKLAMEPHPGFAVYNADTLLKLRSHTSPVIGANFDPSHFFWQGIDPCIAIEELGKSIYHVHAKDCYVYPERVRRSGVLNPQPYSDFSQRSWNFRTVGYGHSAEVWNNIISILSEIGYDGVISVEHEDALMTREEGLSKAIHLLSECLIREYPQTKWWELRPEG